VLAVVGRLRRIRLGVRLRLRKGAAARGIYQLPTDGLPDSRARTSMSYDADAKGGRRGVMLSGLLAVLIVGTLAGSVEADRGDWRHRTPDYPRYSRDYYDGYGSGYGAYGGCGGYRGYAGCGGYDGCRGYRRCGNYGGYGGGYSGYGGYDW